MENLKNKNKVLIIGMDGATFDIINPLIKEGKLPNLAKLIREGCSANLHSTLPPMTFPAWNAFMTGTNPGKHGVFDFTERKPNSFEIRFTSAKQRKQPTLWKILSDEGKRIGVVAVPVNYPPEAINGIVIGGFDSPIDNPDAMYPKELATELKKNVGEYIFVPEIARLVDRNRVDKALSALHKMIDRKAATTKYLLQRESWDFFMILFGSSDVVGHHYWRYHDPNSPFYDKNDKFNDLNPIISVYQKIDEKIGELLAVVPKNTTIAIVSDHGMGGASDRVLYLNKWLEEIGMLRFSSKTESNRILNKISRLFNLFFRKVLILARLFYHWILPRKFINRFIQRNKFLIFHKMESKLRFGSINWSQTYAYSEETPYYPTIWINLKGRDPMGIVEPGEQYEAVRNKVIEEIQKWINPENGQQLALKAYKREEIYQGDSIHKAPDIIIDWNLYNGYTYLSRPSYLCSDDKPLGRLKKDEIMHAKFTIGRSGFHRGNGIFIIKGEGINKNSSINEAHIIDIAPTIMYIMGLAVPEHMDGKVLKKIFIQKFLKKHPIRKSKSIIEDREKRDDDVYNEKEAEQLKKRLKGLGYL